MTAFLLSTIAGITFLPAYLGSQQSFAHPPPQESYAVRIDNEKFSTNNVLTGEIFAISGELKNQLQSEFEVHMAIILEGESGGVAWIYVDPTADSSRPGEFILSGGETIPYSISVIAIKPGTYHVHTALIMAPVGQVGGGDYAYGRGQTVNVAGDEISTSDMERIIKDFMDSMKPSTNSYTQHVKLGDQTVDVGVTSNTVVTNFAFYEEQKRIFFIVGGQTGGNQMTTTTVQAGKVLRGPYTVTMDGNSVSDFEIISTQTSNDQSIRLNHDGNSHTVTITGTQVVPEFPVAMVAGITAAIIGVVAVMGRTRLLSGFSA